MCEDEIPLALQDYVEAQVEEHNSGGMDLRCRHCNAMYFFSESNSQNNYTTCCKQNTVQLRVLEDPPQLLQDLFNNTHPQSAVFLDQIRSINSVFSFTSMGANIDQSVANVRAGVYTFRIHGSIYHRIGSLRPPDNQPARFAQIYFYDAREATERQADIFPNLSNNLIQELTACFEQHNVLLRQYHQIGTRR